MTDELSESNQSESGRFDSLDCIDVVVDGPGDQTVRPCPPELLAQLATFYERQRERMRQLSQQYAKKKPPTQTDDQAAE